MKKCFCLLLPPLAIFSFLVLIFDDDKKFQIPEEGEENSNNFRMIRLTPNGRLSCTTDKGCALPDVKSLHFMIVGDIGGLPIYPYYSYAQSRVADAMAKVAAEIEEEKENAAARLNFILNVGDNFYYNGIENVFDTRTETSFERIYEQPKLAVPWYTIAGNHDHLGNISAQIAHTNFSSKWTYPELFYKIRISFDHHHQNYDDSKKATSQENPQQKNSTNKNDDDDDQQQKAPQPPVLLEILMLDTIVLCGNTVDVEGRSLFSWLFARAKKEPFGPAPEYRELAKRQWKWIEQQLEESDADYLLVAGHYPIYSTCEHGGFVCLQRLDRLLHKYGVNAYFSGHDHNLQHIRMERKLEKEIDEEEEDEEEEEEEEENETKKKRRKNTELDYIVSGAASRTDRSAKHLDDLPESALLFRYPTGWNPFSQIGFSNGGFVQMRMERDQSELNFFDGKTRKRYSFEMKPRWRWVNGGDDGRRGRTRKNNKTNAV